MGADALLIVATDRISAFDVVLPNAIPEKGRVLTALTLFWLELLRDLVPNHLLSADVREYPVPLRRYAAELEGRSMLVRRCDVVPFECVVRGYLAGSGWKDYQKTGSVCGIALASGLRESEKLPEPIFTPATKAEAGHDLNVSEAEMATAVGAELTARLKRLSLAIYRRAADYAASRGIIIADTKFEFGRRDGQLLLADEVLTPDSSRFWPAAEYAPGMSPPSFDKQYVRDYLERLAWNKQPPAPELPPDVVQRTSAKYLEAYRLLTGHSLGRAPTAIPSRLRVRDVTRAKEHVERICEDIGSSARGRLWRDSIQMLSTISESIFSRAAHFILELLQNAEDAGNRGGSGEGEIEFRISRGCIKVSHNASLFTEDDVDAICGVRSNKKPEEGTLGFLGIGFKSVFKITDRPQVYSGLFRFKFDKAHWKDRSAEPWPWQIAPLWVEQPEEPVDPRLTTFVLPFRDDRAYEQTREELTKLDVHIFLFLKWLKKLRVCDEDTGETTVIKNLGGQGRILAVRKGRVTHRFVIFRRVMSVPPEVARDPILEFYRRQGVTEREIVLAFGVDDQDNLMPIEDASTLGSVSSFLPLTEERSGARFLIQSDFLVQPGREAIQYELAWNHWLVSEAAAAAKEAVEEFKKHRKWGSQFLRLFDFQPYWGQAPFHKLFYPKLHAPLTAFLEGAEVYPTAGGGHVKPEKAVYPEEGLTGLLNDSDLASLFPGESGLRLAHRDVDVKAVPASLRNRVKTVSLSRLARNEQLLEQKLHQKNHVQWFTQLYEAMAESGQDFRQEQRRTIRGRIQWYDSPIYVLTDQNRLAPANTVYLRDIPGEVIQLRKKFSEVDDLLESYQLIHPKLTTPKLAKFFQERTHVQSVDYDKVCRTIFLPKLGIGAQAPPQDELVAYTRLLQKGPRLSEPIWVLTKTGSLKPSNQVFFSSAYSPDEDWERNARYVPHMDFLSEEYLQGVPRAERAGWKEFFASVEVKEQAGNPHVEQFAMAFVEQKLSGELRNFVSKNRQQHGYDREATSIADGRRVLLEIKGQKAEHPVELVGNEPTAAKQAKQNNVPFWVCVVPGIPENPKLWVIEEPLDAGEFNVVTIDIANWKTRGRRVV